MFSQHDTVRGAAGLLLGAALAMGVAGNSGGEIVTASPLFADELRELLRWPSQEEHADSSALAAELRHIRCEAQRLERRLQSALRSLERGTDAPWTNAPGRETEPWTRLSGPGAE